MFPCASRKSYGKRKKYFDYSDPCIDIASDIVRTFNMVNVQIINEIINENIYEDKIPI